MRRTAADGKWLNDYDLTFGTNVRWDERTRSLSDQENTTQKKDFATELKEARRRKIEGTSLDDVELEESTKENVPGESGTKAALQKRKVAASRKLSLRKAIVAHKAGSIENDDFMKMLEEIFADEDVTVGTIGSMTSQRTAANVFTGPEEITPGVKGAPSADLSSEENKKQKSDFAAELKECVGIKLGQQVKVVVGASEEEHVGEIMEISEPHGIIHVDYTDVQNRDAIDLKEGKSKVFGIVRVYVQPTVLATRKGNWHAVLVGDKWSAYNYRLRSDRQKLAEVALSDVLAQEREPDVTEQAVTDRFGSEEYGQEFLAGMEVMEANGELGPEAETPTGVAPEDVTLDEIAVGSTVTVADDWLPTGEESDELIHDIVSLRDEQIEGSVEAVNPMTEEVQVNFGGEVPLMLSTAELTLVARDSNATGTDVRWTEESRAISDQENKRQKAEFQKEETAAAFGPDSARNTHLAQKEASKEVSWEEQVNFMATLVDDAGLAHTEALHHVVAAFTMTAEDTDAFLESTEYIQVFEMPVNSPEKADELEFGKGKEVTQMRRYAGIKRHLVTRLANDMLDKGMIDGITADMGEEDVKQALDTQIDKLMRMTDDGLYELEGAVKSANDPDGIEAIRKSAAKIGPREGALQRPLIMRGAGSTAVANTLSDPGFFGGPGS